MTSFFKYPSTPHLWSSAESDIRFDKLLSEQERIHFLSSAITVEEKIDGANLGLSFSDSGDIIFQNRGSLINAPFVGQWKKLNQWFQRHQDELFEILGNHYILFGEWCYAKHSLHYTHLPDHFLAFDIYDKQQNRFLSTVRRNEFLSESRILTVPGVAKGTFNLDELLQKLSSVSHYSGEPMEGLVLRQDNEDWLIEKAKIVNPQFTQTILEHWSHTMLKPNLVKCHV